MNKTPRTTVKQPRASKARWAGNVPDREGEQAIKKMAILRAAAVLFRERGYEHTTLNDIAQALNVTKPTLYYYVKNKEDLLVEIQQTGFDEFMEELVELDRGARSGPEILRRLIMRGANWLTGDFGVCVTRNFLTKLTPENLARVRKSHRLTENKIREAIARGIEEGSLRPCDPRIVTSAILGALNWLAFWYEAKPTRRSAAELGNAYYNLFIEGIGVRAAPAVGAVTAAKKRVKKTSGAA